MRCLSVLFWSVSKVILDMRKGARVFFWAGGTKHHKCDYFMQMQETVWTCGVCIGEYRRAFAPQKCPTCFPQQIMIVSCLQGLFGLRILFFPWVPPKKTRRSQEKEVMRRGWKQTSLCFHQFQGCLSARSFWKLEKAVNVGKCGIAFVSVASTRGV